MSGTAAIQRPVILVWSDLNNSQINELRKCKEKGPIQKKLGCFLHIDNFEDDLLPGIEMDMYYHAVVYCFNNSYSNEQISAYVSMLKRTHAKAIETSFGNIGPVYDYFKDMVVCHSVKRPPFSAEIFNHNQARRLMENTLKTYFKHYKLYKYAFTSEMCLDMQVEYSGIPETPDIPEEVAMDAVYASEGERKDADTPSSSILASEVQQSEDVSNGESPQVDEPAGMTELKNIIANTLNEEIKQIKATVDEQMKANEDDISKKLLGMGRDGSSVGAKSPKTKKAKKK